MLEINILNKTLTRDGFTQPVILVTAGDLVVGKNVRRESIIARVSDLESQLNTLYTRLDEQEQTLLAAQSSELESRPEFKKVAQIIAEEGWGDLETLSSNSTALKLNDSITKVDSFIQEKTRLESNLKVLQEQINETQNQIDKTVEKIQDLEDGLPLLIEIRDQQVNEVEDLKTRILPLVTKRDTYDAKVLSETINHLGIEIYDKQGKLKKDMKSLTESKNKISSVEEKWSRLVAQRPELQMDLQVAKNEKMQSDETVMKLRNVDLSKIPELEAKLVELANQNNAKVEERAKLQSELEIDANNLEETNKSLTELSVQKIATSNSINRIRENAHLRDITSDESPLSLDSRDSGYQDRLRRLNDSVSNNTTISVSGLPEVVFTLNNVEGVYLPNSKGLTLPSFVYKNVASGEIIPLEDFNVLMANEADNNSSNQTAKDDKARAMSKLVHDAFDAMLGNSKEPLDQTTPQERKDNFEESMRQLRHDNPTAPSITADMKTVWLKKNKVLEAWYNVFTGEELDKNIGLAATEEFYDQLRARMSTIDPDTNKLDDEIKSILEQYAFLTTSKMEGKKIKITTHHLIFEPKAVKKANSDESAIKWMKAKDMGKAVSGGESSIFMMIPTRVKLSSAHDSLNTDSPLVVFRDEFAAKLSDDFIEVSNQLFETAGIDMIGTSATNNIDAAKNVKLSRVVDFNLKAQNTMLDENQSVVYYKRQDNGNMVAGFED